MCHLHSGIACILRIRFKLCILTVFYNLKMSNDFFIERYESKNLRLLWDVPQSVVHPQSVIIFGYLIWHSKSIYFQ